MARTKQTVQAAAAKSRAAMVRGGKTTVAKKVPRVSAAAAVPKVMKKRRYHPGTRALWEIRRLQKKTENVIPKRRFQNLVRFVAQQEAGPVLGPTLRFQASALADLQTVAEAHAIQFLEDANLNCVHRKRKTLEKRDMDRSKSSANRFAAVGTTLRYDVSKTEYPGRAELMQALAMNSRAGAQLLAKKRAAAVKAAAAAKQGRGAKAKKSGAAAVAAAESDAAPADEQPAADADNAPKDSDDMPQDVDAVSAATASQENAAEE